MEQHWRTVKSEPVNRELKQQRRRRLRKRHLKSEFALLQTLSRLLHLVYFVKCWQMFLELNYKGLYQSSGKEKQSCCLAFPSSTKREFRHFHVVVVQRRQRNVQKSVMHVQSCCFANLNLLLFLPSSLPSPSSLLKLPERAKESVRIKRVEFRENVRAYFHQGQGIRSVIKRCPSVLSGCP